MSTATLETPFHKALGKLNNKHLPHVKDELSKESTEEVMRRYRTLRQDYMNYKLPVSLGDLGLLTVFLENTISNPYITLKGQEKRLAYNGFKLCEDLKGKLDEFKQGDGRAYLKLSLLESIISYVHEMPVGLSDSYEYTSMIIEGGFLEPLLRERNNIITYQGLVSQEYKQIENLLSNAEAFKLEYGEDKFNRVKEYSYYINKMVTEEKGEIYKNPEIIDLEIKVEDLKKEVAQHTQHLDFIKKETKKDGADLGVLKSQKEDEKAKQSEKKKELKEMEVRLSEKRKEIDALMKRIDKEFKQ